MKTDAKPASVIGVRSIAIGILRIIMPHACFFLFFLGCLERPIGTTSYVPAIFPTAAALEARPQLKLMGTISVANNVNPRWCYDKNPELVFAESTSLYRSDLKGHLTKITQLPQLIDQLTLQCSIDGSTIFALSMEHDTAFVVSQGAISKYALAHQWIDSHVRTGSPMSPDGAMFVLRRPRLIEGPDVLRMKSVYSAAVGDVFWGDADLIERGKSNVLIFRLRANPSMILNRVELNPKTYVDNIQECGSGYVVTYSDAEDHRYAYLFDRSAGVSQQPIIQSKFVGRLHSANMRCVISVMSESGGVLGVKELILMRGKEPEQVDIKDYKMQNDRFEISKDGRMILTYQPLPQRQILLYAIMSEPIGQEK